jgi:hypothetical protein
LESYNGESNNKEYKKLLNDVILHCQDCMNKLKNVMCDIKLKKHIFSNISKKYLDYMNIVEDDIKFVSYNSECKIQYMCNEIIFIIGPFKIMRYYVGDCEGYGKTELYINEHKIYNNMELDSFNEVKFYRIYIELTDVTKYSYVDAKYLKELIKEIKKSIMDDPNTWLL